MRDVLLDGNDDLSVSAGDFVVGGSANQNQKALIIDHPGDWKEHPTVGVGAFDYTDLEGDASALANAIAKAFTADGMRVEDVKIINGIIEADADY
jgi:hypothetical protein